MSYTDIGKATGLSTSAAQQRVRRLEQRGVITVYNAQLSAEELGRTLTAFISVRALNSKQDEDIPAILSQLPEITSCFSVAGETSFLCMAEVGSTRELDQLLASIRHQANVSTSTTIVLTTIFRARPLIDVPSAEA